MKLIYSGCFVHKSHHSIHVLVETLDTMHWGHFKQQDHWHTHSHKNAKKGHEVNCKKDTCSDTRQHLASQSQPRLGMCVLGDSVFSSICAYLNDHRSAVRVDFGVVNKWTSEFTNMDSVNTEHQLCLMNKYKFKMTSFMQMVIEPHPILTLRWLGTDLLWTMLSWDELSGTIANIRQAGAWEAIGHVACSRCVLWNPTAPTTWESPG